MVATQIFLCSHLFGEDFPSWPIFFRWVEGNHQPEKVNLAKPKSSKKTLGWWKIQKKIPWIPPFSWTCWSKTCAMFALFQKSEDVCGGRIHGDYEIWVKNAPGQKKCGKKSAEIFVESTKDCGNKMTKALIQLADWPERLRLFSKKEILKNYMLSFHKNSDVLGFRCFRMHP